MPAKPSIWEYLPQPERDCIPPRDRQDRQVWPGYWIYHNRDDSISFGTEQRDYLGWLPAEITRADPESLSYAARYVDLLKAALPHEVGFLQRILSKCERSQQKWWRPLLV